jgi:hypothetical protein
MTTNNIPAFEAFTIREGVKGRKSYFTKVGVARLTKNGTSMMLYLDAVPHDGRLYLTPPKPPKAKEAKDEAPATETPTDTVDDDGPYIEDEVQF